MKLSIVIPTLNEEEALPETLAALARIPPGIGEVIVVDGGSTDATIDMARVAGARVISAVPGRASQMNAGARVATGDVLLFLHADTIPPVVKLPLVAAWLARSGRVWGRFDVRIAGRSRSLAVVAKLINLRSRLSGIATGDQAIFMSRLAYDGVGGFPDQPLMEDVEMSIRLKRMFGRPLCLQRCVTTSGRRWDGRGPLRTIVLMWRLRLAYWIGVAPHELARVYR